MSAPEVSIVVPAFNRLPMLQYAIASVFAQAHADWELIISDDGSDEPTRAWLRSLAGDSRVRVLWLAHSGNPAVARNAALAMARGEFIAFLDSDDAWTPDKLAIQIAAHRGMPERRWSYTAFERMEESNAPVIETRAWVPREGAIFSALLDFNAIVAMPTVVVERRLLEEVGFFDVGLRQYEDYELWLRLARRNEVQAIDNPLAKVRRHGQHYFRGGLWAQQWWRSLLERVRRLDLDSRQRAAVASAVRRNATQLARAYAARGQFSDAMKVFRRGWNEHGASPGWWLDAPGTALRLVTPGWLRIGYRRLRGQSL
jgi:glycosyltransferase involved in cell wall biosynthesis